MEDETPDVRQQMANIARGLTGMAATWYANVRPKDIEDFVWLFKQTWGEKINDGEILTMLMTLKQETGEGVSKYALRF